MLSWLNDGVGPDQQLDKDVSSRPDQVPELLYPFLHSDDAKERWVSALTLGRLKDEEATPVLIRMLTEFLPTLDTPYKSGDERLGFDIWRIEVADILQHLDDRRLMPSFRQALVTSVHVEAYNPFDKGRWFAFQDVLISALGRWRAFGTLTGLALSPVRFKAALVTFAAGACSANYYYPNIFFPAWEKNEQLRQEMKVILAEQFGLLEREQEQYLAEYGLNMVRREDEQNIVRSKGYVRRRNFLLGFLSLSPQEKAIIQAEEHIIAEHENMIRNLKERKHSKSAVDENITYQSDKPPSSK